MVDQLFNYLSSLFLISILFICCAAIPNDTKEFLEDAKVTPSKLIFVRDSVSFELSGTIPIESILVPKNPHLKLVLKSSDDSRIFENIELVKKVAEYSYRQDFLFAYEDWMEGAYLELQLTYGKKNLDSPSEKKVLARGVITTPLMAKVGKVHPDEPIPQIGLYLPTGAMDIDLTRSKTFLLDFAAGSSEFKMSSSNQKSLDELKKFITENSSISSFKITGVQSPEAAEGENSKLGLDRAMAVKEMLSKSSLLMRDSLTEVKSRWHDWFDFRLLLREYDKISTSRKDQLYNVLTDGNNYDAQSEELKKVPGFTQVSRDLYPQLRSVKIEVVARPLPGLNQSQAIFLKKSLGENSASSELDISDWAIAGETTPRLDDKSEIYSKMTELFRSALPYNNLAVVKMRQAQQTLNQTLKDSLWLQAKNLLYQASKIESNPYILHNQGQIMVLQGKSWEAYKKLSEASVMTRNEDFLIRNESLRGALDILRGDYKLATLRFNYDYSDSKDFFNKGLAYFLAEDYANASLSFEESVVAGRNYGYGFYGLALVAAQSGQEEIAIIQLYKAIHSSEVLYQKALVDPIFEELRKSDEFFQIFKPSS
jgi:outer membrane protein OmpA-like peptidoglycan-associated protein